MAFQAIFPAQWAGRAKPRAERSDALGCNEMTTMRPNGARETVPTSRPSGTMTVAPNGNVYKAQGNALARPFVKNEVVHFVGIES